MKAVSLWSGGKDSCFAFYKARNSGYDIKYLLNFTSSENPGTSISHGISAGLINDQASSVGVPILQRCAFTRTYEAEFKKTAIALKKEGIDKIVFGDIYLREHRDWIDKICGILKVEPIFPIWRTDTDALLKEFIDEGFESLIVSVRKDALGEKWLGKKLDAEFMDEIYKLADIDPCGEKGEFHTVVLNGPCFQKRIEIIETEMTASSTYWFLKILDWRMV